MTLDIPQWLSNIAENLPALLTGAVGVLYTRWRYIKDRQFSTVNDKKRFETFEKIGELEKSERNPLKESMIKALYESIGMFFPRQYNRYLLEYMIETGLPYKDKELNYFIRSVDLMNINIRLNQFELNKKKRFHRLIDLWVVIIFVTLILIPVSFIIFKSAHLLPEGKDVLGYVLSGAVGGAWAFLYVGFVIETQRCISAKLFSKKFLPWLDQKRTESESTEGSA
ncbi:hypothetical protein [Yersinia pseudotuberculosis]|uniref:hypothetical protein n=1 Tax=Yersinia pseudotuberculosis TaxID=633 RepID=UPI0005E8EEBD|nr:hypothetical protein [Yersinia pseudotuberculosis]CND44644.1 Uncharacterised protein [Yersinia pseudotuberculosis]